MDVRVRRHTSDTASFVLAERDAHPRLRGLVLDYEDFEERSAEPLGRREVAVPHVVVILDLSGAGWDVAGRDATAFARHRSFVAGVHDQPTTVRHDGRARCLQLNLTPLGARAVLGVPPAELANRVVPLEDLLGPAARRLEDRRARRGAGVQPPPSQLALGRGGRPAAQDVRAPPALRRASRAAVDCTP